MIFCTDEVLKKIWYMLNSILKIITCCMYQQLNITKLNNKWMCGKVSAPFFFNQKGLYQTDRFLRLLLGVWVLCIDKKQGDNFNFKERSSCIIYFWLPSLLISSCTPMKFTWSTSIKCDIWNLNILSLQFFHDDISLNFDLQTKKWGKNLVFVLWKKW